MEFKLFTLEEANRCLDEVSGVLGRVNGLRQDLICLLVELDGLRSSLGKEKPDYAMQRRIEGKVEEVSELRNQLQALNGQLRSMGLVVRDFERGLVDFPTIIQGQPGYLCWQAGEDQVGFWHGPEDGFAGRRPLGSVTR